MSFDTLMPGPAIRATALGLAVVTLSACAALAGRQDPPPVETYLLEPAPAELNRLITETPCRTLAVEPLRADPGYATDRMAYTRGGHRLDYFAYHRWTDDPAHMLTSSIVEAMDTTGAFRHVVMAPTPVQTDVALIGHLRTLRQRFTDENSDIELVIRIALIDNATGRLLATRSLRHTEPAVAAAPDAGVAAAHRAAREILDDMARAVVEALPPCETASGS